MFFIKRQHFIHKNPQVEKIQKKAAPMIQGSTNDYFLGMTLFFLEAFTHQLKAALFNLKYCFFFQKSNQQNCFLLSMLCIHTAQASVKVWFILKSCFQWVGHYFAWSYLESFHFFTLIKFFLKMSLRIVSRWKTKPLSDLKASCHHAMKKQHEQRLAN